MKALQQITNTLQIIFIDILDERSEIVSLDLNLSF